MRHTLPAFYPLCRCMPETPPDPAVCPHPHKRRRGLVRLGYATLYSLQGLADAVRTSAAFRLELGLAVVGIPLALWLGRNWLESVVLAGALVWVLVVEMLNCAIESAIDRIGHELHPLSRQAKDFGSAAVFLSSLLCGAAWLSLLWLRWVAAP